MFLEDTGEDLRAGFYMTVTPVSLLGLLDLGVASEAALMLLAPLMWFWSPQARTQLRGNRSKQGLV